MSLVTWHTYTCSNDSIAHVSTRGRGIKTTLLLANIHFRPEATSFPVFWDIVAVID